MMRHFDQRGGVWVGASTLLTIALVILESLKVIVAPSWWVSPTGIYTIILGFFVLRKGTDYFVDSRWNSPPGERPAPKDAP
jgi:hypothetical protein